MSWSFGDDTASLGDASSWQGAPLDGVDVVAHMGEMDPPWHRELSEDHYLVVMVLGFLAVLWLLGGVAFKGVNH